MRIRVFAWLLAIALSACSGTRATNPVEPVPKLRVDLDANHNSSIRTLRLCMTRLELVSTSGTSTTVDLPLTAVDVTEASLELASAEIPESDYERIEGEVSPSCGEPDSVALSNQNGTYSSTESFKIRFTGGFAVSSLTRKLKLDTQAVFDQLAVVSSSGQIKTVAQATSGAVRPANAFVWVGLGYDNRWSTGVNWKGGVAPSQHDIAVFDASCGLSCNVTLTSALTIEQLVLDSSYTGTFTQGPYALSANVLTVDGGTYSGSSLGVTTGRFSQAGGTFTSTSGVFEVRRSFLRTGGIFNANGGDVALRGGVVYDLVPGGATLHKLTLRDGTHRLTGTVTVFQLMLIAQSRAEGGTVLVTGHFKLHNSLGGTTRVKMIGSEALAGLLMMPGSIIPGDVFTIERTGGTLQLFTDFALSTSGQDLQVVSGTLNMAGFALTIDDELVNDGVINRAGGTLTYGSLSGSGTINP